MSSANASLANRSYMFRSGQIISGQLEALGSWVTVNYASKKLTKVSYLYLTCGGKPQSDILFSHCVLIYTNPCIHV